MVFAMNTNRRGAAMTPIRISRRSVLSSMPLITVPLGCFAEPARLNFDDSDFATVRKAVRSHLTANAALGEMADCDRMHTKVKRQFDDSWALCTTLATEIYNAPAMTVRDVFLRAETLTMFYGGGMNDLLES